MQGAEKHSLFTRHKILTKSMEHKMEVKVLKGYVKDNSYARLISYSQLSKVHRNTVLFFTRHEI